MATTNTKLLAHSRPVIGSIYHVIIKRTRFTRKYSEGVSIRAGERGYAYNLVRKRNIALLYSIID